MVLASFCSFCFSKLAQIAQVLSSSHFSLKHQIQLNLARTPFTSYQSFDMKTTLLFALVSLFASADAILIRCPDLPPIDPPPPIRSGDSPVSPDHHRSLANENPHASIVHFDPDTMTIPRHEVATAVQAALIKGEAVEAQEPVQGRQAIVALNLSDMVIKAPAGLATHAFTIENVLVSDSPGVVFKVVCPANSPQANCHCFCTGKPLGLSSCTLRDEDIPSECTLCVPSLDNENPRVPL